MSVVARFRVHTVEPLGYGTKVVLSAIYSPDYVEDDPVLEEVRSFYEATPNGQFEATIANEKAEEQFQVGDEFYVRLEKILTEHTVAAVAARHFAEKKVDDGQA